MTDKSRFTDWNAKTVVITRKKRTDDRETQDGSHMQKGDWGHHPPTEERKGWTR